MIMGRSILSVALFLIALFITATQFVPSKVLIELTRIVHVSIAFAVMVSYAPSARIAFLTARDAYKHRDPMDPGDILNMAIFLSFTSHFIHGWWMIFWRLAGQPPWMVNSDITAFTVSLAGLAGLLYLAAPRAIDGHVPPSQRLLIGSGFGLGFLLIALIFVSNVDLSTAAEFIRPLIEDEDGSTLYGRARASINAARP